MYRTGWLDTRNVAERSASVLVSVLAKIAYLHTRMDPGPHIPEQHISHFSPYCTQTSHPISDRPDIGHTHVWRICTPVCIILYRLSQMHIDEGHFQKSLSMYTESSPFLSPQYPDNWYRLLLLHRNSWCTELDGWMQAM